MALLQNIRHDMKLRNVTVYAQWASLAAILACWVRGAWVRSHIYPISFSVILYMNIFLFPIPPVLVIMPYISRYTRYFLWASLAWWFFVPFGWVFTTKTIAGSKSIIVSYYGSALLMDLMLLQFVRPIVMNPQKRMSTALFHLGFTIWSFLWLGEPQLVDFGRLEEGGLLRPHFEWPAILASLATALYFVAYWKKYDMVLSRTLGGPGLESMSLILRSSEPEYNAIADEGRIRLP